MKEFIASVVEFVFKKFNFPQLSGTAYIKLATKVDNQEMWFQFRVARMYVIAAHS